VGDHDGIEFARRSWTSGGETRTSWVADYRDQGGKRHLETFGTRRAAAMNLGFEADKSWAKRERAMRDGIIVEVNRDRSSALGSDRPYGVGGIPPNLS
jgi:hypothetical protein